MVKVGRIMIPEETRYPLLRTIQVNASLVVLLEAVGEDEEPCEAEET